MRSNFYDLNVTMRKGLHNQKVCKDKSQSISYSQRNPRLQTNSSNDRSILTTTNSIENSHKYKLNQTFASRPSRHLRIRTDASMDVPNHLYSNKTQNFSQRLGSPVTDYSSDQKPDKLQSYMKTQRPLSSTPKQKQPEQKQPEQKQPEQTPVNRSMVQGNKRTSIHMLNNQGNQRKRNYPIVALISRNEIALQDAIDSKNFVSMMNLMVEPLELCQTCQEMKGFCKILVFLAKFAFHCDKINSSTFLFHQALIVSEVTRNYLLKIKTLLGLAACARRLKEYDSGIMLLKKALVYAWKVGCLKKEVLIYDLLGITYFYQGDLMKAKLYHNMFLIGKVEPEISYIRETSSKYVKYFEQRQSYHTNKISSILMIKLCLPIRNKLQQESDDQVQEQGDWLGNRSLYNCDGSTILSILCSSYEFVDLNLDNFVQEKRSDSQKQTRKIRLKEKMITTKEYSIQIKVNDINKDKQYGAVYQQNQKQLQNFEAVMQRVNLKVTGERTPFTLIQDKIFMSHLNHVNEDKPYIMKLHQKKYRAFFQRLVEYLLK